MARAPCSTNDGVCELASRSHAMACTSPSGTHSGYWPRGARDEAVWRRLARRTREDSGSRFGTSSRARRMGGTRTKTASFFLKTRPSTRRQPRRKADHLWNPLVGEANARDDYAFALDAGHGRVQRRGVCRAARAAAHAPRDSTPRPRTWTGHAHDARAGEPDGPSAERHRHRGDAFLERRGRVLETPPTARSDARGSVWPMNHEGLRARTRAATRTLRLRGHRGDAWRHPRQGVLRGARGARARSSRKVCTASCTAPRVRRLELHAGQNVGDTWLDTELKDPVFAVDGKPAGARGTAGTRGTTCAAS